MSFLGVSPRSFVGSPITRLCGTALRCRWDCGNGLRSPSLMTKIHGCLGKFSETEHLTSAFGGMLPARASIACALRAHLRGQRHVTTQPRSSEGCAGERAQPASPHTPLELQLVLGLDHAATFRSIPGLLEAECVDCRPPEPGEVRRLTLLDRMTAMLSCVGLRRRPPRPAPHAVDGMAKTSRRADRAAKAAPRRNFAAPGGEQTSSA